MPDFKTCVVIGDKVYCYDKTSNRYVEARLEIIPNSIVPMEAIKQIVMKQFDLVEREIK